MAVRPSSREAIDQLIADLASDRVETREAAVARLTVIGTRAVERVAACAADPSAGAAARSSALRALEGIGDRRGLDTALRALADADASVAIAAVAVTRVFLRGRHGLPAVDRLTALALDRARLPPVRAAAVRALGILDGTTLAPLREALEHEPNADLARLLDDDGAPRQTASGLLQQFASGTLDDDPPAVREALAAVDGSMPVTGLLEILELVREKEREASARRDEWTATRGAAHVALAKRGSRLGLYDLRDSLAAASRPLPVDFLAALSAVGDRSCLEPIAAARARSADPRHDWWRDRLQAAFQAIVEREKLTRRHAAIRRIEERWGRLFWKRERSPQRTPRTQGEELGFALCQSSLRWLR